MGGIPDEDLGKGLNAKHRWQYARFSFGGDAPESAYGEGHARTFGEKPSPFCQVCGLRFAWCECKREEHA